MTRMESVSKFPPEGKSSRVCPVSYPCHQSYPCLSVVLSCVIHFHSVLIRGSLRVTPAAKKNAKLDSPVAAPKLYNRAMKNGNTSAGMQVNPKSKIANPKSAAEPTTMNFVKSHYDCEGPLGVPMKDAQARLLESLL